MPGRSAPAQFLSGWISCPLHGCSPSRVPAAARRGARGAPLGGEARPTAAWGAPRGGPFPLG
eukprot:4158467-Pyramimonas_sp.AAC.1